MIIKYLMSFTSFSKDGFLKLAVHGLNMHKVLYGVYTY